MLDACRHVLRRSGRLLRSAQKTFFRLFGLEVFLYRKGHHYVPDLYGRSAAKQVDIRTLEPFGSLAGRVVDDGQGMLYYDRLYTIYQALSHGLGLFPEAGAFNTAEVGVYKGGTSFFIASVLRHSGAEKVEHHCFDTFEGHAEEDINPAVEVRHRAGKFSGTSCAAVTEYLKDFANVRIYKGRFQDTCGAIAERNFRFVHLDMDIYEPTLYALRFFEGRMAAGGMIVVDDCGFETCPGIVKSIDEFCAASRRYAAFRLLSGQCLLIHLAPAL